MKKAIYRVLSDDIQEDFIKFLKVNKNRKRNINDTNIYITRHLEKSNMLFCEMLSENESNIVTTIENDYSLQEYEFDKPIVQDALYFAIVDKHLLVSQTSKLRIKTLEKFISDALEKTTFKINEYINKKVETTFKNKNLKKISIKAPIYGRNNLFSRQDSLTNKISKIFKADNKDSNIYFNIDIGFKNKPQNKAQDIMNALRDLSPEIEEDFKLEYFDGSILDDNIIRVQEQLNFENFDNFSKVCEELYNAMYRLIKDKRIDLS